MARLLVPDALWSRIQPLLPPEAPVYEDIFPRGAVSSETCADANARPAPAALRIERVVGADGVTRLIMKQTPRPMP